MSVVGVCGSINMDVIGYVDASPRPGETVLGTELRYAVGGKGANQAVAASNLGADVLLIGARGSDDFGRAAEEAVARAGVDVTHLKQVHGATGVALVVVARGGENQIVVVPGANEAVDGPPPGVHADVWVTQAEIPVAAVRATLATARSDRAVAIVNPSPAHRLPPALVAGFDVAIVNREEFDQLDGNNPPALVVTLGAEGVRLLPSGKLLAPTPASVLDATGAGDALAGGVAAGLAEGMQLEEAVRLGMAAASICIERPGAMSAMPSRREVESRLTRG